jgi:hypothetical protein
MCVCVICGLYNGDTFLCDVLVEFEEMVGDLKIAREGDRIYVLLLTMPQDGNDFHLNNIL